MAIIIMFWGTNSFIKVLKNDILVSCVDGSVLYIIKSTTPQDAIADGNRWSERKHDNRKDNLFLHGPYMGLELSHICYIFYSKTSNLLCDLKDKF